MQDVSAWPEGGVLVRQPSHRPAHPIGPHREGRPKLQPVPGGAGAGAARLHPDITTIIKKQQQNIKKDKKKWCHDNKETVKYVGNKEHLTKLCIIFSLCMCVCVCACCVCVFGVCACA